jgi:hypothetical protein
MATQNRRISFTGLAGRIAGEQPRIALRHQQPTLAHDGRHVARDRDAVDLALFGGRGGFRPAGKVEVELFKPRLAHFARPRAGQHAKPDDPRRALIIGGVQRLGQSSDLVGSQEPLAFILDPAAKCAGGIVFAPAPADRQSEHFAQHLTHTVGTHRRRLHPLQLAGPVVGLGL